MGQRKGILRGGGRSAFLLKPDVPDGKLKILRLRLVTIPLP